LITLPSASLKLIPEGRVSYQAQVEEFRHLKQCVEDDENKKSELIRIDQKSKSPGPGDTSDS
jgi:hypothetical protein